MTIMQWNWNKWAKKEVFPNLVNKKFKDPQNLKRRFTETNSKKQTNWANNLTTCPKSVKIYAFWKNRLASPEKK